MLSVSLCQHPARSPTQEDYVVDIMEGENLGLIETFYFLTIVCITYFRQRSYACKCTQSNCSSSQHSSVAGAFRRPILQAVPIGIAAQFPFWKEANAYSGDVSLYYMPTGKVTALANRFFRCTAMQCVCTGKELFAIHSTSLPSTSGAGSVVIYSSICREIGVRGQDEYSSRHCTTGDHSIPQRLDYHRCTHSYSPAD